MTKARLKTKAPPPPVIEVGPCSDRQRMVFERSQQVDFMIIGGSRGGGKSECLVQLALQFKDDPRYDAIYVRTELPQLMGSGGLWDIAQKYYPLFGAKAVQNPRPMFTFPSKAKVRFKQIANTQDSEKQRGLQFSSIMIDEITQLPKEAVIQLMACLRSEAKMNSFMCGTCNPSKDNWVFDLVRWYLDEEGYVDQSKNGVIRYFVTKDNSFVFADTEEWFKENMPETVMGHNPITGEDIYLPPKRFCFIQLTIFDNPIKNCGLV